VLTASSPIEQGRATLGDFATVGHGAAALDLAMERASSLLLSPFESSCWVRLPLADPVHAPPCPVMAGNGRRPAAALPWRLGRRRGHLPSALFLGQVSLGPERRAGPPRLSPHSVAQAESGRGPVRSRGPGQFNKEKCFMFFFFYLIK
jgi:hypothetical protein